MHRAPSGGAGPVPSRERTTWPPRYRSTPLEVASGLVFGFAPPEPLPAPQITLSARQALEQAILPALLRPPCLMSFSGGRASSAVLAVAVLLARREGLELPVPATNRLDGVAGRNERAMQERVIVHLGLMEWVRLDFSNELDLVGPVAMRVLREHGLLWPFHTHFSRPPIEWASGGSLITGLGDRNALGEPGALLRRDPGPLRWLRPDAQVEVRKRWKADAGSRPHAREQRFAWWRRLRQVRLGIESLQRLGAELRVEVCHPLIDPIFSRALGALPPHRRSATGLFGDLLPRELLAPRAAPPHEDAFWRRHSRALVENWHGEGVDTSLVDIDELRHQWLLPRPDPRTFLLLQSVALERETRSSSVRILARAL
jgi:hypothetical protein